MKHGNFSINVTMTPSGTAYMVKIIDPLGSLTISGLLTSLHECWSFAEDTIARYLKNV